MHLTQIVEEKVTTQHLCERCAAERGVESAPATPKTPLGSFLAAMGKSSSGTGPRTACEGCGATLQDFREVGRLGCPACYTTFGAELRDLLRRLHGSTTHVGDRYELPGASPEVHEGVPAVDPLAQMRDRLQEAVVAENFELAAELRDRLRGLEGPE